MVAIVKLSILVEDHGDGDLSPFIMDVETLAVAQEQVPNAVILHHMTVMDDDDSIPSFGSQKLVTTLNALTELSFLMDQCEIQDLFMKFFLEGMKAGKQYEKDQSLLKMEGIVEIDRSSLD